MILTALLTITVWAAAGLIVGLIVGPIIRDITAPHDPENGDYQ